MKIKIQRNERRESKKEQGSKFESKESNQASEGSMKALAII